MNALREFNQHIWFTEVERDGFDVRSILIIGTERVVVWDTLTHPNEMKVFLPMIQNKELIIVYSHADWDHIWGTAGLPYQGKVIVGHSACLTRFGADVPEKLHEKQSHEPNIWNDVKLVGPNLTFQTGIFMNLGDLTLSLHDLPGHSPDCIVAFIPELGVLLAGDTVETPFPGIYEDSPLDLWIEELEQWAQDTRVEIVVPSHGAIGGRDIIIANVEYLQNIRDGIEIKLSENVTDFYRETHQRNLRYRKDNRR